MALEVNPKAAQTATAAPTMTAARPTSPTVDMSVDSGPANALVPAEQDAPFNPTPSQPPTLAARLQTTKSVRALGVPASEQTSLVNKLLQMPTPSVAALNAKIEERSPNGMVDPHLRADTIKAAADAAERAAPATGVQPKPTTGISLAAAAAPQASKGISDIISTAFSDALKTAPAPQVATRTASAQQASLKVAPQPVVGSGPQATLANKGQAQTASGPQGTGPTPPGMRAGAAAAVGGMSGPKPQQAANKPKGPNSTPTLAPDQVRVTNASPNGTPGVHIETIRHNPDGSINRTATLEEAPKPLGPKAGKHSHHTHAMAQNARTHRPLKTALAPPMPGSTPGAPKPGAGATADAKPATQARTTIGSPVQAARGKVTFLPT